MWWGGQAMSVWDEYSEKSARAKLARHRARGDLSVSTICVDGKWYVGNFSACSDCMGWGREFANGFDGTTRQCSKCHGKATA